MKTQNKMLAWLSKISIETSFKPMKLVIKYKNTEVINELIRFSYNT